MLEKSSIQYILTDIEGTTTSVSFVYDVLFPYFRNNIKELESLLNRKEVQEAFEQTKALALELEGVTLKTNEEIIAHLLKWSLEDKKITPLKSLQGILWETGYKNGSILGHVYEDVKPALSSWKNKGIQLGVFSSGSVQAQKLIFGYSEQGDLTPFFSHYFDTNTGGKREKDTYIKISENIQIPPSNILFLSDIVEELKAADDAGFQTIQLVRPGTTANWGDTTTDFLEVIN